MKKLYSILKILLWSVIGSFVGSSVYQYYQYKTYSELYTYNSAPWYLIIEIRGIFTAIVVLTIFIIMCIIRKKIK